MHSQIIILNGTSSAGKSTLAHALRPYLPLPFCYYASDQLAGAGFRPPASRLAGEPAYWASREQFLRAFIARLRPLPARAIISSSSTSWKHPSGPRS